MLQLQKLGVIGLPRTESGKIIVLPIQPEDLLKGKRERVKNSNRDYEPITNRMRGLVSGGVKEVDRREGEQYLVQLALIREMATEWGIVIDPTQIGSQKGFIGNVEQRRNGDEIDFLVYALWCVFLHEEQVAALDRKALLVQQELGLPVSDQIGTIKLSPNELSGFLAEQGQTLRPAARLALMMADRDELHQAFSANPDDRRK